jgi:plastocyanin
MGSLDLGHDPRYLPNVTSSSEPSMQCTYKIPLVLLLTCVFACGKHTDSSTTTTGGTGGLTTGGTTGGSGTTGGGGSTTTTTGGGGAFDPLPDCTAANAQAVTAVSIVDNQFMPNCITVAVGSTVTFTNNGQAMHSVTANGGQTDTFDTDLFGPGVIKTIQFSNAGTVLARCRIHGTDNMDLKVLVTN